MRPSIGNGTRNKPKERREDDIHQQINREQGRQELRPAQGNGEMVGIAQIEARNTLLLEHVRAKAKRRGFFAAIASHWSAWVPSVLHSVRRHHQLTSNEGPNAEIGLERS